MVAKRKEFEDAQPVGDDRAGDARPPRARRPLKARPPAERVDVAAVHHDLAVRYPIIRARLAE